MTESLSHRPDERTESQQHHASLYERTCASLIADIQKKEFPESTVPKHIEDLRQELAQCLGLNLITEQFYERWDAALSSVLSPEPHE